MKTLHSVSKSLVLIMLASLATSAVAQKYGGTLLDSAALRFLPTSIPHEHCAS